MSAPVDVLTGFARALRAAGVAADRTRLTTSVAALARVDPRDRDQVYWATRLTLCSEPDDLPKFDALFDAWFGLHRPPLPVPSMDRPLPQVAAVRTLAADVSGEPDDTDEDLLRTAAADTELLRTHDIAALSAEERAEVHRMIALLAPRVGTRRTLRLTRGGRKRLDVPRTVRQMLRDGGEPGALRYQRRRDRPRRLVLLLDVSGSMAPYADVLLRLAHTQVRAAAERRGIHAARGRARVEVFTIGTRLTRVTTALQHRDVEVALRTAGEQVPDWSGGTRLGEVLRAFADRWGQRGVARGAVVVVCSDGWERGDTALLAEQAQRLHRLAHRLVWVNPHRGKVGYEPVQAGIAAVLPHVDDFVAGHSVASYVELMEVLSGA